MERNRASFIIIIIAQPLASRNDWKGQIQIHRRERNYRREVQVLLWFGSNGSIEPAACGRPRWHNKIKPRGGAGPCGPGGARAPDPFEPFTTNPVERYARIRQPAAFHNLYSDFRERP
ncbi:hypothetical protein EVAR_22768_1 [Eumeta japonica]|uniref:Uncharacterized protein n=1 Tax=Eumeta variegata TaxID=151549 RepID=A0A4C1USG8_EUMVA|nr:hypothetical protein EVAR_22768_1 [Eumeta japonica]